MLLIALMMSVLSCAQRKKEWSKEFAFEMRGWSFFGPNIEVFLYNTDLRSYPRERFLINKGKLNENTLYILKTNFIDTLKVVDTLRVKLNGMQVDSLYRLAENYLSSIDMDNEIKMEDRNKVNVTPTDAYHFSVSLEYNNKQLSAREGLYNSELSDQAVQLFNFINKKLPEDFEL